MRRYWAVEYYSKNKLDGVTRYWMGDYRSGHVGPLLFRTRSQARAWAKERMGYIKDRPDLMAEPHGWRVPRVYKVTFDIYKVGQ